MSDCVSETAIENLVMGKGRHDVLTDVAAHIFCCNYCYNKYENTTELIGVLRAAERLGLGPGHGPSH